MDAEPILIDQQLEPLNPPVIESPVVDDKPLKMAFISPLERNKFIFKRYAEGIIAKQIAEEVSLSEVRIGQIIRENKHIVNVDREREKVRRLHRLRLCEEKTSKKLGAKDAGELVKIIEAQRKELEPDSDSKVSSPITNIQININTTNQSELWEQARKLLE